MKGREKSFSRVKITKKEYNQSGYPTSTDVLYLVEVMKLNKLKRIKRADEHVKRYALRKAARRETLVECEIGCGKIPGVVEGQAWPYARKILFNKIQDYSSNPGLYHQVKFESSSEYSFDFMFDHKGNSTLNLPYFL